MDKKTEIKISGDCLKMVVAGVREMDSIVRRFKTETRNKLEYLYTPINERTFGMKTTDGIEIQMHNLGRSIENIELWFNLTEMLLENMESDLRTISAVQKIRNEAKLSEDAFREREQKREQKREYDRAYVQKKRGTNKVVSD